MKPTVLLAGMCIAFGLFTAGCRSSESKNQLTGTVRIYTSMYANAISKIKAALNKDFPHVAIEFVQGETGALQTKIEEELLTGNLECDIMMLADPSYSLELKERGILHAHISPNAHNIALPYDPEGYWYSVRVSNMVLAYNPEKKQQSELAQTFKDFAEQDCLHGTISMPNPLMSGTALAAVSALYDAYGESFFQKLQKQCIVVESSQDAIAKLETGEYDQIMVLEEAILKKREEVHSPLEIIYPGDGCIAITSSIMTVKHEYAANKNTDVCNAIVDWFLSQKGQKAVVAGWMHSVLKNPAEIPYGARTSVEIFKNTIPIDWIKTFQNREHLRQMFTSSVLNKNQAY